MPRAKSGIWEKLKHIFSKDGDKTEIKIDAPELRRVVDEDYDGDEDAFWEESTRQGFPRPKGWRGRHYKYYHSEEEDEEEWGDRWGHNRTIVRVNGWDNARIVINGQDFGPRSPRTHGPRTYGHRCTLQYAQPGARHPIPIWCPPSEATAVVPSSRNRYEARNHLSRQVSRRDSAQPAPPALLSNNPGNFGHNRNRPSGQLGPTPRQLSYRPSAPPSTQSSYRPSRPAPNSDTAASLPRGEAVILEPRMQTVLGNIAVGNPERSVMQGMQPRSERGRR